MENSINDNETVTRSRFRAWGSIGILFSAFAFIVLIAAFYIGLNYLLVQNNKNIILTKNLQNELGQQREQLTALQNDNTLKQLQEQINTQQQTLNTLRQNQQGNNKSWGISEAQYLVKLANDNLIIGDNVPLVITLLQSADQRIQLLNDDKLNPLRQALAADITALQALPQIDTTGIYAQLAALNNEVDTLPLPNKRPETIQPTDNVTAPWYKRGWQQTLNALKQIVVIRYNKPGEQPFVAPDSQQFLYQNLHASLEQAMFAVIRKQPEIYQLSLKQAQDWITKYFLQDAPSTQAILTNIAKLQAQTIRNKLPTLDASLTAFENAAATTTGA